MSSNVILWKEECACEHALVRAMLAVISYLRRRGLISTETIRADALCIESHKVYVHSLRPFTGLSLSLAIYLSFGLSFSHSLSFFLAFSLSLPLTFLFGLSMWRNRKRTRERKEGQRTETKRRASRINVRIRGEGIIYHKDRRTYCHAEGQNRQQKPVACTVAWLHVFEKRPLCERRKG